MYNVQQISKKAFFCLGLLGSLFFFNACEQDDDDPDYDLRDEYVGTWTCNETAGDFAPQTYDVTISKGSGSDAIRIANFYNLGLGFSVTAIVSENNLNIASQIVDGYTLSGSGNATVDFSRINWNYNVNDGSGTDNVTAHYVK